MPKRQTTCNTATNTQTTCRWCTTVYQGTNGHGQKDRPGAGAADRCLVRLTMGRRWRWNRIYASKGGRGLSRNGKIREILQWHNGNQPLWYWCKNSKTDQVQHWLSALGQINHELCFKCFKDNITETSLSCVHMCVTWMKTGLIITIDLALFVSSMVLLCVR